MFGSKISPPKPYHTRKDLVKEIFSFRNLIPDWDGFGAAPLEIKAAANAVEVIHLLEERLITGLEDIYPNPTGSVSLVWRNEIEEEVSVEIGNETMSYYVQSWDQEPLFCYQIKLNRAEIDKVSCFVLKL